MKETIKRKLFPYILFLIILSIFAIIYALLIFANKTSSQLRSFNTITFIIGVVLFFLLGILSGNTAQKNGLLEGLIAALIIILITLVINFFIKVPFVFKSFIKTITYLIAASFGGIIGVNIPPIIARNKD